MNNERLEEAATTIARCKSLAQTGPCTQSLKQRIRMRTKSFVERPLYLKGLDVENFMEKARPSDFKPFMAVYYN